jgi:hypothetical protein
VNFLEITLNTHNFLVVFFFREFQCPWLELVNGFPLANSHYFIKIRGDVIQNAACYLGINYFILTLHNRSLFDLVLQIVQTSVLQLLTLVWLSMIPTILLWLSVSIYFLHPLCNLHVVYSVTV